MFLVPEDLTGTAAVAAPDPAGAELAVLFQAIVAALIARNGPLTSSDIAHVIEVLKEINADETPQIVVLNKTDALVLVVSEETGIISLAVRGKLERQHTPETLREALLVLMDAKKRETEPETASEEV